MSKEKLYPHDNNLQVERKKTRFELPEYFTLFMILLPCFAGVFAGWGMMNLHLEVSAAVIGKAILIGVVVAIVSYAINRFAIDWGTELAAEGYWLAGSFSLLSMMAVGACLWFFSFGGIVLPDVRILSFEDHGIFFSQNLQSRQEQANKATRIVPVIAAARDDFAFHAACERDNGCVSGRGGGAGTLSRVLGERSARAGGIAGQLDEGTQAFTSIIEKANGVLGEYQSVLNDDAKSLKEKRQALIALDGQFVQAMVGLEETIPVPLIAAYAQELLDGVTIPNRPDATRAVNALLRKHGQALQSVLGGIERETVERTQFPGKAGLSDTQQYVGNFAPLAGVIWVAEGIFPLALWIYTLLFLIRQRDRAERISDSNPAVHASSMLSASAQASAADHDQGAPTASLNGAVGNSNARKSRRRHGKSAGNSAQDLNGSAATADKAKIQTRPSNSKGDK